MKPAESYLSIVNGLLAKYIDTNGRVASELSEALTYYAVFAKAKEKVVEFTRQEPILTRD